MSNSEDPRKKPSSGPPHISDMILGSLKPRTGKETSKWIAGLADDSALKEAAEAAARENEAAAPAAAVGLQQKVGQHTVITFMDHLFDCFQQYEFDFNRSVAGTDLVINIDRPVMAHENIKQQFITESVQVFRGRISTRSWTFIIRGRQECIEGWILPIEKMISFTADQSAFVRFLYIQTEMKNNSLTWNIDGVDIPWENVRALAKMLFGALIRVAKGEAGDAERFSLRAKPSGERTVPPASSAQLTAQAQAAAPNYSFNEHNPAFESPFKAGNGGQTAGNPRPQQAMPPQSGALGAGPQISPVQSINAGTAQQTPAQQGAPGNPMAARIAVPANPMAAPIAAPANPLSAPPAMTANPMVASEPASANPMTAAPTNGQNPVAVPQAVPANPMAAVNPASLANPLVGANQAASNQMGAQNQTVPANPMAPQTNSGWITGIPQTQPMAAPPGMAFSQMQMPQQLPQQLPQALPQQLPQQSQQAQMHASTAAATNEPEEISIDAAFELLNSVVSREMTKMSAAGAEAFTKQDMAAIEQAFKRTTKLKQLHEEIGRTVENWKATLKEAVDG